MEIYRNEIKFNVRKALSSDRDNIKALIFDILEEYKLIPDPMGIDGDLEDVESSYSGGYFGVIELEDGKIIGTFGLYKMSPEVAEIRKMYLHSDYRGLGLGRWMVNRLIQLAKEMHFQVLELETATVLKEAISLYQRMGFTELKSPNQTPRCDKSFAINL